MFQVQLAHPLPSTRKLDSVEPFFLAATTDDPGTLELRQDSVREASEPPQPHEPPRWNCCLMEDDRIDPTHEKLMKGNKGITKGDLTPIIKARITKRPLSHFSPTFSRRQTSAVKSKRHIPEASEK
ncbi:hypothetical protein PIB30_004699 [Stylosanthes scabra]|uniref:Uncharacterized protein n=1 Tax=Stylosanthes scabra TaxID=79078 RepID=A0ABU6R468_9FABA|nr:hypothetical protein [Stylosanthes scabra]